MGKNLDWLWGICLLGEARSELLLSTCPCVPDHLDSLLLLSKLIISPFFPSPRSFLLSPCPAAVSAPLLANQPSTEEGSSLHICTPFPTIHLLPVWKENLPWAWRVPIQLDDWDGHGNPSL